jgi:hypothetical protein
MVLHYKALSILLMLGMLMVMPLQDIQLTFIMQHLLQVLMVKFLQQPTYGHLILSMVEFNLNLMILQKLEQKLVQNLHQMVLHLLV